MFQPLKQIKSKHSSKSILKGTNPIEVDWGKGSVAASIKFSDGKYSIGSCIRCFHFPCIEYASTELNIAAFNEFPSDSNPMVCPTSAITWPIDIDHPIISTDECILCGICVIRCPVKAIHLTPDGAVVNDEENEHFILTESISDAATTETALTRFINIPEKGIILRETTRLLNRYRIKFEELAYEQNAQFPNHLVRNLLISIGIGAAMRRRGDNNIRMDLLLGPPGINQGTAEVELGNAVIDAPRNILDNLSVLASRYRIPVKEIIAIVICLELPNQRSEYWQLIADIKKVLDIKIGTLTIGALSILIWNRKKVVVKSAEEFYIDKENPNLTPKIELLLGRDINNIKGGYSGLFKSFK